MMALSALTLTWPLGTPALRKAMLSTFWASATSSGGSLWPPTPGTEYAALWATPSATPSRYFARRAAPRERRRSAAPVRSRTMCRRRAPCWRSKKKYSTSAPTPPATSSAAIVPAGPPLLLPRPRPRRAIARAERSLARRTLLAARTRGRPVMRLAIDPLLSCSLGSPWRSTPTNALLAEATPLVKGKGGAAQPIPYGRERTALARAPRGAPAGHQPGANFTAGEGGGAVRTRVRTAPP